MRSAPKSDTRTKKVVSKTNAKVTKPFGSASSNVSKEHTKVKTTASSFKVTTSDNESTDSDDSTPPVTKRNGNLHNPQSDSSSEDSSDDSSEEDNATSTKSEPKKVVSSSSSSEDSDSDEDDVPSRPLPHSSKKSASLPQSQRKPIPPKIQQTPSSDETSESSDEDEPPAKAKKVESASDESDDESDDESLQSSSKIKFTPSSNGNETSDETSELSASKEENKKRTAAEPSSHPPKRMKLVNGAATTAKLPTAVDEIKSIFVGRLSWNVDNDWLAQEFAECGEVVSATVQMDRNTGKSRGFGYVHFATTDAVQAALALNGKEIDGRPVNIDKSHPPDKNRSREGRAKGFGDELGPPSNTLFVANLSYAVKEDTLWELFGEYGHVKSIRLPTDRETGRPKGIGYVEFESVESAKKAIGGLQQSEVEGRDIRLDFAQPRDNSGAGGRGGHAPREGRGNSRGGFRGFGDRGSGTRGRAGRGGFGGRSGRGAHRGGIAPFEGKKTTFS